MQIVLYDDQRLGVLAQGSVRDISGVVDERWRGTPYASNALIASWDDVALQVAELATTAPSVPLSEVRLLPPIPRPRQLFAAPLNYRRHVAEMVASAHAPDALKPGNSPSDLGFFVKATGSISGPSDAVELPPLVGRSFHHEVELGVVVGRPARGLHRDDARECIFGYLCLLDITMRTEGSHQEERTLRKSFETFTPIGPVITTADEVPDPGNLRLRLWVNDELRQDASTTDLIFDIPTLIECISAGITLYPGDIIATGTPVGVGIGFKPPKYLKAGDVMRITIDGIGELRNPLR